MKLRRVILGEWLGSLRYMGSCFGCSTQFMSRNEAIHVHEKPGVSTKYCAKCATALSKDPT